MVGERGRHPYSPLLIYVAALEGAIALQVGVAPELFDAPAYAPIKTVLVPVTVLFALGGAASLAAAADLIGERLYPCIFLVAAAPLIPWSAGFVLAGSFTAVVSYSVVAATLVLAAFALARRSTLRVRPYVAMVSVIEAAFGTAMLVRPEIFRQHTQYAELGSYLWLIGPMFLAGGTGLMVGELRGWDRRLALVAVLAAADLAVLASVFAVTRLWTGTLSYGVMALVLLIAVSRRSTRFVPQMIIGLSGLLGIWDLLVWYAPSSLPELVPEWAAFRPSTAAALIVVVAGYSTFFRERPPEIPGRLKGAIAAGFGAIGAAVAGASALAILSNAGWSPDSLVLAGEREALWAGAPAAAVAIALAGLALVAIAARPTAGWAAHVAALLGIATFGVSALNVIAYMLSSPVLLALYGPVAMRLHPALALATFSVGLLVWALEGIARGSVGSRIFAGLYGLVIVAMLRTFVADQTIWTIASLHRSDPSIAVIVADSADVSKVLLALGGVALLWTWIVITRTITRPLDDLQRAIQRTAAGERRVRVGGDRADEIGAVIRAFDDMNIEISDAHDSLAARSAELAHTNERYRTMLQAQSDLGEAVIIIESGELRDWNDAFPRIIGRTDAELRALPDLLELVPAGIREPVRQNLRSRVGQRYHSELPVIARGGAIVELDGSVIPLDAGSGRQMAILRDVTDLNRAHRRLEQLALHDDLTGLANRTLFVDRVERAIRAAGLVEDRIGLLYLDLDRFKEVNDALGHAAGDRLLREVGQRLIAAAEPSDTVARFGGDEFAILHPSSGDVGALAVVAERIAAALRPAIAIDGQPVYADASVGIVAYPDHGEDATTLLRNADVAMYDAKRGGRHWAVYAIENDPHSQERLAFVSELREALDRNELVVEFQPQLCLRGADAQCPSSAEALARWDHPRLGRISANEFIPVAEETGLIEAIDQWVRREALHQCAQWQAKGIPTSVSVNLSMRTLRRPDIDRVILAELAAAGLPPCSLITEVTESWMMQDPRRTEEVLSRLAAAGVRVSIDDFGTGYSSLLYLQRLPVRELKIDARFVGAMLRDPGSEAIVRSTIELGHALGLVVVAEGVEDQETTAALNARGCDVVQGFAVAPPLSLDDLMAWFDGKRGTSKAAA